jgi:hypothetical protein
MMKRSLLLRNQRSRIALGLLSGSSIGCVSTAAYAVTPKYQVSPLWQTDFPDVAESVVRSCSAQRIRWPPTTAYHGTYHLREHSLQEDPHHILFHRKDRLDDLGFLVDRRTYLLRQRCKSRLSQRRWMIWIVQVAPAASVLKSQQ